MAPFISVLLLSLSSLLLLMVVVVVVVVVPVVVSYWFVSMVHPLPTHDNMRP